MNQLSKQSKHKDNWGLNEVADYYLWSGLLRFSFFSEIFHTSLECLNACNPLRFEIVSGKKDIAYNYKIIQIDQEVSYCFWFFFPSRLTFRLWILALWFYPELLIGQLNLLFRVNVLVQVSHLAFIIVYLIFVFYFFSIDSLLSIKRRECARCRAGIFISCLFLCNKLPSHWMA